MPTPRPSRRLVPLHVALLASAAALPAQLRTVRTLSLDGANRAIAAATAEARRLDLVVSIAVVDASGELVAFARMDGAPWAGIEVAQGKARTAARFRRPTRALDSSATAGRPAVIGLPGVVPVEGGVPVVIDGEVVGALGVSGAASAQDAQIARAGGAAIGR